MFQHEIRTRLITAAALAALAPPLLFAQSPMKADEGWAEVARCARADSESARHTCLDRLLRDAGLLTAEMSAQQQRRSFGLEERAAVAPPPPPAPAAAAPAAASPAPAVTAAPKPATRPAVPAPTATVDADRLEVEIASVQKAADGRLAIETKDGALWRQTESVEMPQPPMAGNRMSIRKGALNGYRCSVPSTRLTFRCARSR